MSSSRRGFFRELAEVAAEAVRGDPPAVESALSGVMKKVGDTNRLWYRRTFMAPKVEPGHRLLLHFGAVDWHAIVWVNGKKQGEHKGGYDPFTFDITDALQGKSGSARTDPEKSRRPPSFTV